MARNEILQLCRLQAVTADRSEDVPEAALCAFDDAAQQMDRPGVFESRAIAVDGEALRALTGFSPRGGEFIPREAVRRSAEVATPARTSALGNARPSLRNDYIALAVFLRVCAAQGLELKADLLTRRAPR